MFELVKKRIRTKMFWVSIAALIPLSAYTFGFELKVLPEQYELIVAAVLNLLVVVGIVDPTIKDSILKNPNEKPNKELEEKKEEIEEKE